MQQNAECSFLHKVCLAETAYRAKNTGRLERKHLSIQRPAEIFQQGTIPGKIYPGRSSRGGRITGAGFLLQKNTFFQKGRPVPALNRPEHFISGLPALPEGNPASIGGGNWLSSWEQGQWIIQSGLAWSCFSSDTGAPASILERCVPQCSLLRPCAVFHFLPDTLSPVSPVLSFFILANRILQSQAQTAKLPFSAEYQFRDFPGAFHEALPGFFSVAGPAVILPCSAPCNNSIGPGHHTGCG